MSTIKKGAIKKANHHSTFKKKLPVQDTGRTKQGRTNVREQQKTLRKERREKKEGFQLIHDLKSDWENLRQKKLPKEKRAELLSSMMQKAKGHIQDLIFRHDASRIVQSMVKYGTLADRETIAKELKGKIAKLSTSKYGKFLILNLLQYLKPFRTTIAEEFYGKVCKLMKHIVAAPLLETIYTDWISTAQGRYAWVQELYHPEFYKFKTPLPLSELVQTRSIPSIQEHLLGVIQPCIEKGILGQLTLVQRAALDYLSITSEEQQQSFLRELHPVLLGILHHKEGSLLTMRALSRGTPKDRKSILKSFKWYVMKIASEEFGFRILIQSFCTVDDVVLLEKYILKELDPAQIPSNPYVMRVFRFLVTGISSRAFPNTFLELLEQHGKKEGHQRYSELFQLMSTQLLPVLSEHLIAWLAVPSLVPFVLDYLSRTPEASTYAPLLAQALGEEQPACFYTSLQKLLKYVFHWKRHVETDLVKEGHSEEGRVALLEVLQTNQACYASTVLNQLTGEHMKTLVLRSPEASFMILALCEDEMRRKEACEKLFPHLQELQDCKDHGCQLVCQALQQGV